MGLSLGWVMVLGFRWGLKEKEPSQSPSNLARGVHHLSGSQNGVSIEFISVYRNLDLQRFITENQFYIPKYFPSTEVSHSVYQIPVDLPIDDFIYFGSWESYVYSNLYVFESRVHC